MVRSACMAMTLTGTSKNSGMEIACFSLLCDSRPACSPRRCRRQFHPVRIASPGRTPLRHLRFAGRAADARLRAVVLKRSDRLASAGQTLPVAVHLHFAIYPVFPIWDVNRCRIGSCRSLHGRKQDAQRTALSARLRKAGVACGSKCFIFATATRCYG
jgi:hypothetical protein